MGNGLFALILTIFVGFLSTGLSMITLSGLLHKQNIVLNV